MARPSPDPRSSYAHFSIISTRWMDNDAYGHVNNVIYYSFFDTVVNEYLIRRGVLDIEESAVIGLVVETGCHYFSAMAFPDTITAGLRVARLGSSSVRYEVGLFRNHELATSARGHFVHVYVDRVSRKPSHIPVAMRRALEPLLDARQL